MKKIIFKKKEKNSTLLSSLFPMEFTLLHLIGCLLALGLLILAFRSAGPTHGTHDDPVRAVLHGEGPRIKRIKTETSDSEDDSSSSTE